jgi:hypothetical protein
MRRLLLILAFLVVIAVAISGLRRVFLAARSARPEIALADSTVLRVEGLTWGTNQTLLLEPAPWTRLKQTLPNRWRQFTGQPLSPRQLGGDQSPHLWLSQWDPAKGGYVSVKSFELSALSATGQKFRSQGYRGFGSAGKAERAVRFEALDWRADPIRFRLQQGSVTQEFSLPNPRRGERFPVWNPLPLPQTNSVGGFDFVLTELRFAGGPERYWHPEWDILRNGRSVTDWFSRQHALLDPTGNRAWSRLSESETVCRVEVTAYPAARYPFAEGQLFPLGRFTLPGPGSFAVVPLTAGATNACLHWAAFSGPGSFGFRDGTNWLARPPGGQNSGNSSSISDRNWEFTITADHPQFDLVLRGPVAGGRLLPGGTNRDGRLLVRARRPDGTFVSAESQGYSSTGDGTTETQWVRVEFAADSAGQVIDVDLTLVAPLTPNPFTVAAPKRD